MAVQLFVVVTDCSETSVQTVVTSIHFF